MFLISAMLYSIDSGQEACQVVAQMEIDKVECSIGTNSQEESKTLILDNMPSNGCIVAMRTPDYI